LAVNQILKFNLVYSLVQDPYITGRLCPEVNEGRPGTKSLSARMTITGIAKVVGMATNLQE